MSSDIMRCYLNPLIIFIITSLSFSSIANDKILIIGDSLSAGYGLEQEQDWVYLLQNKYNEENRNITIVNAAVSGQTTDNALLHIQNLLKTIQPSHVLIELGGNDGIRGFPVNLIQNHLTQLIISSQQQGALVALMQINIPPNLGPRYNKMFTESYAKVAQNTKAYLIPFFMTDIAIDKNLMLEDNLHPNAKAQPIIRDFMYSELNKWLNFSKGG